MRDPIVGIPTKYEHRVCEAVRDERLANKWVLVPSMNLPVRNPDAVGGVEMLYGVGWPHDWPPTDDIPGLDEEHKRLLSAVAAFEGEG